MSVRIVHRPARITTPVEPPADVVLAPPPPLGEHSAGFPLQSLLPVVGSLSSITMIDGSGWFAAPGWKTFLEARAVADSRCPTDPATRADATRPARNPAIIIVPSTAGDEAPGMR